MGGMGRWSKSSSATVQRNTLRTECGPVSLGGDSWSLGDGPPESSTAPDTLAGMQSDFGLRSLPPDKPFFNILCHFYFT